ncbi:mRNA decay activator protein ZFP36L2-like [Motacilla alba alba]|uniref:mRNA decay activator protein ZFP36L2-like n=1 Tax=Motacilla alba alba TaxID=1094192 RepID=UPI0018D5174C|nr:mRNA decay activator protein ZFP36L2-like [Motacilla alba alba]
MQGTGAGARGSAGWSRTAREAASPRCAFGEAERTTANRSRTRKTRAASLRESRPRCCRCCRGPAAWLCVSSQRGDSVGTGGRGPVLAPSITWGAAAASLGPAIGSYRTPPSRGTPGRARQIPAAFPPRCRSPAEPPEPPPGAAATCAPAPPRCPRGRRPLRPLGHRQRPRAPHLPGRAEPNRAAPLTQQQQPRGQFFETAWFVGICPCATCQKEKELS